jgi:hypothetical protein
MEAKRHERDRAERPTPFTVVHGIAQDGGVPQTGSFGEARWNERARRGRGEGAVRARRGHVACFGIVDAGSGKCFIVDAMKDLP